MAGLPASGKTAIARELARQISAVHIRIDTIEQAVVRSGAAKQPLGPVGYVIGYAVAADCLRQGLRVVADSVNPLPVTREAWREVAREAGVRFTEIEVVCSDPVEHRRRVSSRVVDIPDLVPPTWQEILDREYEPWPDDRIVIDTAGRDIATCVRELRTWIAC